MILTTCFIIGRSFGDQMEYVKVLSLSPPVINFRTYGKVPDILGTGRV